ncbi:hypothetical protein TH53_19775 [Pedobacter lusitanus]|uniref:Uncharacterized protein n=1 Tax=Pedobacter lusitanus TaxID=1503925 RepID=A0A0D0GHH1_9SPHI|nr:hypothetical protein [Pedobacter lusitanus]KIO75580.1 hypothetical protein TH53_19775 [Pedobacter lusitanus]
MAEEIKPITTEDLVKSQASYKGNSQSDLVEIEIIKDGSFYVKGDKDSVHPTTAAIMKAKGLIKTYKGEKSDKAE